MSYYEEETEGGRKRVRISIGFMGIAMIIVGIVGGYLNSGLEGGLAGLLLAVLLMLISIVGVVPIAGVFLYMFITDKLRGIIPTYINLAGETTYTILYWIGFVLALIKTIAITIILLCIIVVWIKRF